MSWRTPARYARRAANVLRGRDIWQRPQIREQVISLGNGNASWRVSPIGLTQQSIVYSVGVGENISFDLALIEGFGLRVHAFDPTPRSMAWLQAQSLPAEFVFHAYGLAGYDGVCRFTPPADPAHVSYSLMPRPGARTAAVELPVRRLSSIMRELGHSRIDLLKMDIEGAEYDVLADMLAGGIEVSQLLVEFHHRWREIGIARTKSALRALHAAGYRIFHVSARGEEYSFRKSKDFEGSLSAIS